MGMTGFSGSGALATDKLLGNAFQIVRHVQEKLPEIIALAGMTDDIALLAANLNQAEASVLANQVAIVLAGSANFRATFAEALTDFAVGEYFSSTESGELRLYQRVADGTGYEDMGDVVAPISRTVLAAATGAALIGVAGGGNLQAALNARPTAIALAEDTGAASVGSTGDSNVQADLNARPTAAALALAAGAAGIGSNSVAGATVAAALANLIVPFHANAVIGNLASAINTAGKYQGKQVFCTDNNKVHIASGPGAADIWWGVDGLDSITPVAI